MRSFPFPLFNCNNNEYLLTYGGLFEPSIVLCTNSFNLHLKTVGDPIIIPISNRENLGMERLNDLASVLL